MQRGSPKWADYSKLGGFPFKLVLPRCCVQVTYELISARCDAPQPLLLESPRLPEIGACTWHLCCALQACTLLCVYSPVNPLWPCSSWIGPQPNISIIPTQWSQMIFETSTDNATQLRLQLWRAQPRTAIRWRSEPSRQKVGNYAQLHRAGQATPRPHDLSLMSERRLSNTCLSLQTQRRCHYHIILPSASVSVAGCAPLGPIACPAVTRSQVSALPLLALPLFFSLLLPPSSLPV